MRRYFLDLLLVVFLTALVSVFLAAQSSNPLSEQDILNRLFNIPAESIATNTPDQGFYGVYSVTSDGKDVAIGFEAKSFWFYNEGPNSAYLKYGTGATIDDIKLVKDVPWEERFLASDVSLVTYSVDTADVRIRARNQ